MGKNKVQRTESLNAFIRMNYLYQAANVVSKTLSQSVLANYYGRIMKEVAKKVVEKIHPDVKRTLCSSCSCPLLVNDDYASVKIRPHKRSRKKNKRNKITPDDTRKRFKREKLDNKNYPLSQREKKNLKPNKVVWNCNNCGYSRTFLQRPSHYIWIEKSESI